MLIPYGLEPNALIKACWNLYRWCLVFRTVVREKPLRTCFWRMRILVYFWFFWKMFFILHLFNINKVFILFSSVNVGCWPNHVNIDVLFSLTFCFSCIKLFFGFIFRRSDFNIFQKEKHLDLYGSLFVGESENNILIFWLL